VVSCLSILALKVHVLTDICGPKIRPIVACVYFVARCLSVRCLAIHVIIHIWDYTYLRFSALINVYMYIVPYRLKAGRVELE
jgi:hypothetical protein